MKSLTPFLECFNKKFKLFKKSPIFLGWKKPQSCLGGGGGGTNKKFELHLSNPWKSLLGSSSKTQVSVGLI
jgi:hypothetical protein